MLLLVTSVMNGFERELTHRVLGVMPHITVRGRTPIADWQQTAGEIGRQPGVLGVAPFIDGPGLVVASGHTSGVLFTASTRWNGRVSDAALYVVHGEMDALCARHMGRGARRGGRKAPRGVGVGDVVTAILPEATVSLIGITPRQKRLHVVGLLLTESELDGRAAYLHIDDASRLFRLGKRVHGIETRIDDVFAADATAERILAAVRSALPDHVDAHTRQRAIAFQRAVMFLLLSLLVGVAAFIWFLHW